MLGQHLGRLTIELLDPDLGARLSIYVSAKLTLVIEDRGAGAALMMRLQNFGKEQC